MKLILLLLAVNCGWGQIGASPAVASPEIVKLMRSEAASGFTVAELREFKRLHDADAEMLRRIVANSQKYSELERFVSGLDITVDTRLLIQATADIKDLQRIQKTNDDSAKAEREASSAMIQTIKTGTIMLVIGAVITAIISLLKWRLIDPKRRRAAQVRWDAQAQERTDDLIGHVDRVKTEIIKVTENTSQKSAVAAASIVAEKTQDLSQKVEYLGHRVDRLGTATGGMPTT